MCKRMNKASRRPIIRGGTVHNLHGLLFPPFPYNTQIILRLQLHVYVNENFKFVRLLSWCDYKVKIFNQSNKDTLILIQQLITWLLPPITNNKQLLCQIDAMCSTSRTQCVSHASRGSERPKSLHRTVAGIDFSCLLDFVIGYVEHENRLSVDVQRFSNAFVFSPFRSFNLPRVAQQLERLMGSRWEIKHSV